MVIVVVVDVVASMLSSLICAWLGLNRFKISKLLPFDDGDGDRSDEMVVTAEAPLDDGAPASSTNEEDEFEVVGDVVVGATRL